MAYSWRQWLKIMSEFSLDDIEMQEQFLGTTNKEHPCITKDDFIILTLLEEMKYDYLDEGIKLEKENRECLQEWKKNKVIVDKDYEYKRMFVESNNDEWIDPFADDFCLPF